MKMCGIWARHLKIGGAKSNTCTGMSVRGTFSDGASARPPCANWIRNGAYTLRELDTKWGLHELDIICYVPIKTPYSCMADGLVIGTGNTIGRLDLRLAEVVSLDLIQVCIHRKDGTGPVLIFKPRREYLRHIDAPKPEDLEKLSRECSTMEESDLFEIERLTASKNQR